MATIISRAVNLIAAGLLAGNELGSLLNVHSAFDDLDVSTRIRAEQAITERYGPLMPFFMSGAIASFLPVLWWTFRARLFPFLLSAGGLVFFVVMLAVTLIGNVPINDDLIDLDPASSTETAFDDLRTRWTRLHVIRNALDIAGLLVTVAAALYRPGNQA